MYKRGNTDEIDESIINNTLTAIKNGYYHLDGAEGMPPPPLSPPTSPSTSQNNPRIQT
jgi:hypothetical protein